VRLLSFLTAFLVFANAWGAETTKPAARIDINNATQQTIETLPGVGPKLALAIIEGRPYTTIDDLDRVKGIGPAKLEKIRHRIYVVPMRGTNALKLAAARAAARTNAPPTGADLPAPRTATQRRDINAATQEELETLPGIGPKRAEAIIAARPFKKIEDLQRIPGLKGAAFDRIKPLIFVAAP
jgi:competence protein ComEA